MLLWHLNIDFENKMYDVGPAPDYDKSGWLADKFSLGLQFPNLPYLIDGDIKLTEY
jgi:glutathione S-transferase